MKYFTIVLICVLYAGCSGNAGKEISTSGTIEGTDVNISAEVAGKIKRLWVNEGSQVAKGDTLLQIDDAEYQLQLLQAMANQNAAEAQYRLALEGSRKEDILQAEAAFKNAESDYKRMKDLLASHTATQRQYDDAEARYISTQQTYEKLVRGSRKEEIELARARKDQASAQTELVKKKFHDCTVIASSDGILSLKAVEPGEFVTVGANLLRISYLKKVSLIIYVGEADLGKVKLGQKAAVSIDAFGDKSYEGTVVYISQTAEFTPKNIQTKEERTKLVFAVKIEVENPDGALKPGLPADAKLTL